MWAVKLCFYKVLHCFNAPCGLQGLMHPCFTCWFWCCVRACMRACACVCVHVPSLLGCLASYLLPFSFLIFSLYLLPYLSFPSRIDPLHFQTGSRRSQSKLVFNFLCFCEVLAWLSGVRCKWFSYGSVYTTATPSLLASLKSIMVLPSAAGLPRSSWTKMPLNECSSLLCYYPSIRSMGWILSLLFLCFFFFCLVKFFSTGTSPISFT